MTSRRFPLGATPVQHEAAPEPGPRVMIALSRIDLYSHVHDLVVALRSGGWTVAIRAGVSGHREQDERILARLPAGVSFRPAPRLRDRWAPSRYRLLLLAGWGVYVRSGDAGSRYYRRLTHAIGRDGPLRRTLPTLDRISTRRSIGTALLAVSRAIWRFVPLEPGILADVRGEAPHVVIAAGRNYPAYSKRDDPVPDHLEAARRVGIPTVALVLTWDNLTTKGTFLTRPDMVLAWNSFHRDGAVLRHRLSSPTLRVVGSTRFETIRSGGTVHRDAAGAGTTPARILYLGSSANIAPDESPVVRELCARLRQRDLEVEVIVRPHPANYGPFRTLDEPNAVVWPPEDQNDLAETGTASFRSALEHSLLAVGINTSGFLDAAALGVRVLSLAHLDRDGDGAPSRHLRALLDYGVVEAVPDIDRIIDKAESALLTGPLASDPDAVAAALAPSVTPPSEAVMEVLSRTVRLEPRRDGAAPGGG